MKEVIDTQIRERAPWIERSAPGMGLVRGVLHSLLAYDRTLRIAEGLEPLPAHEIMREMVGRIAHDVEATGLENVPRHGPAMLVCNHPTGIADGIILYALLADLRPDLFFFANVDAVRIMPQLDEIIAPVEWRADRRSHGDNRATLAYARRAFKDGRLGIMFPSGRLAKRRGFRLHERPWMPSAAMLIRKFGMPVVPLHIRARNSALFYFFDLLHPTLRDITLFHEVLNKDRQRFQITAGEAMDGARLPANSAEATDILRRATLSLAGDPAMSMFKPKPRAVATTVLSR
ncbi:1-acyl-sn-glycerol-3-phosphate acyltransferase [Oceanomicrobium pacificus]|uniref:Glycerol acyltransferase n=1 Tax=Oceanomicrobium pacificus TaxID=2692916 RepID=A0A6B0TL69_9RHOB|nr:1-acyl-sn-glycerol-3-phosphate acyltransferase [Oceanomicrobium pacificus]MXU65247.1 glycerol acyltransferase [Oceanomicrobium pacificus]